MSETCRTIRRLMLPYGVWGAKDGRLIVFNRNYFPILQRFRPGDDIGAVAADPGEWVRWKWQTYFYHDGTPNKEQIAAEAFSNFTGDNFNWSAARTKLQAMWRNHGRHIQAVIPPLESELRDPVTHR